MQDATFSIGRLERRLDYQTASEAETSTNSGSYSLSWATTDTVWASVDELTGRELLRAGQADAATPVVVTCRYAPAATFTAEGRFLDADGRVLDILAIREIGRGQFLEFACRRNDDGGV